MKKWMAGLWLLPVLCLLAAGCGSSESIDSEIQQVRTESAEAERPEDEETEQPKGSESEQMEAPESEQPGTASGQLMAATKEVLKKAAEEAAWSRDR